MNKYKFHKGRHGNKLNHELENLGREIAYLEFQIRMLKTPLNDKTILALNKIVPG